MGESAGQMLHEEITAKILAAAFDVMRDLGAGFLETVYQNAMIVALREQGLTVRREAPFHVSYHGVDVGNYVADIIVNDKVLVELKAVKSLAPEHQAQVINYLKASRIDVGLLINFGHPTLEYKRLHR